MVIFKLKEIKLLTKVLYFYVQFIMINRRIIYHLHINPKTFWNCKITNLYLTSLIICNFRRGLSNFILYPKSWELMMNSFFLTIKYFAFCEFSATSNAKIPYSLKLKSTSKYCSSSIQKSFNIAKKSNLNSINTYCTAYWAINYY